MNKEQLLKLIDDMQSKIRLHNIYIGLWQMSIDENTTPEECKEIDRVFTKLTNQIKQEYRGFYRLYYDTIYKTYPEKQIKTCMRDLKFVSKEFIEELYKVSQNG